LVSLFAFDLSFMSRQEASKGRQKLLLPFEHVKWGRGSHRMKANKAHPLSRRQARGRVFLLIIQYLFPELISMAMKTRVFFILLLATIAAQVSPGQPFLSRLQATKDSPIFTTYAAVRERSEFIIDEGYQLVWTDSAQSLKFGSDHGGFLSLAIAGLLTLSRLSHT
jgi:hypothetical protein